MQIPNRNMTLAKKQSKKSLMKRHTKPPFNVKKHLSKSNYHGKIAVALFLLILLYVTIGMVIFSQIEGCKQEFEKIRISNATKDYLQEICGDLENTNSTKIVTLVTKLQDNLKKDTVTHRKNCEPNNNEYLSDWFEYVVITIHAIGYGKTPESILGKIVAIFYSIFGLFITVAFYKCTGIFISNLLKILIYKAEVKRYGSKRKTIKHLHLKSFGFNFLLLFLVVIIASAISLHYQAQHVSNWMDALYFWWVTITTVGNGNYRYHVKNSSAHLLLSTVFILFGISFLSSCLCIILDAYKNLKKNRRRKRGSKPSCCCFCLAQETESDNEVMFKDASTQNWGSLLSLHNGGRNSGIELTSIDGSLHGGILENSNRVDSQCTIKRLSEIERERSRNAANESESENDADDELGIIAPIMVTAAVATKRTVSNLQ